MFFVGSFRQNDMIGHSYTYILKAWKFNLSNCFTSTFLNLQKQRKIKTFKTLPKALICRGFSFNRARWLEFQEENGEITKKAQDIRRTDCVSADLGSDILKLQGSLWRGAQRLCVRVWLHVSFRLGEKVVPVDAALGRRVHFLHAAVVEQGRSR